MVTLFKLVQLPIVVAFIIAISDHRQKNRMHPLMPKRLTLLLKLLYIVPLGIYVYTLVTLERVLLGDLIALAATLIGTLILVKAKDDLGRHHTWTGYYSETTEFVSTGIYAFIRHPIYTGIGVFMLSCITVYCHAAMPLAALTITSAVCILMFVAVAASKETTYLENAAPGFSEYSRQVHPFLPLRRFEGRLQG